MAVLSFMSGCGGSFGSDEQASPEASNSAILFENKVMHLDFGVVPRGGRKEMAFWVTNAGTEPVEIAKTESSCHCLQIELSKPIVSAGERVDGLVKLHLMPDFAGRLLMDAKGSTPRGETAFVMAVTVQTREENAD